MAEWKGFSVCTTGNPEPLPSPPSSKRKRDDKQNQETSSKLNNSLKKAQYWYYHDTEGSLQGPFFPGQMGGWLQNGYIDGSLSVGPSFQGEVPTEFHAVSSLFDEPLNEHAFIPGPGIANMPPEEVEEQPEPTREEVIKELSSVKRYSEW